MPPFVNTDCPHCQKINRFDYVELKSTGTIAFKRIPLLVPEENEEFAVTCQHCGRKFKFTLKGGTDGQEEE